MLEHTQTLENGVIIDIIELPDTSISLDTFQIAGEIAAKQSMRFTPETYQKIDLEPTDIIITNEQQPKNNKNNKKDA